MGSLKSKLLHRKGKIMGAVSEAAGDRRSEAKADFEAATGSEPSSGAVEAVEKAVRRRHRDIR